jgi:hypothetical protein
MSLVAAGWRNKQIAGKVQTSEATVKVQRTNLMRKMQASSLADLIVMAGGLGYRDKSSSAPNGKQGALNQGLDSLPFFLAHLASVQSTSAYRRLSPALPGKRVTLWLYFERPVRNVEAE